MCYGSYAGRACDVAIHTGAKHLLVTSVFNGKSSNECSDAGSRSNRLPSIERPYSIPVHPMAVRLAMLLVQSIIYWTNSPDYTNTPMLTVQTTLADGERVELFVFGVSSVLNHTIATRPIHA